MDDRRRLLLRGIDVSASLGLELGPLANPVVTRDMGRVHYLDHVDTEALRARYRDHIGFDLDAIVPIDHVMGEGSIAAAVQGCEPFDYVVASHIVEHVPDPVRWLADIRSVMHAGGVLALAVPDHRQCFDALRSPSVAADLVEACLAEATVPSPRQVYDHHACAVSWRGQIVWNDPAPDDELVVIHSEAEAHERAADVARHGTYHDVHCWVFTPQSFASVFRALARQGLLPFRIDHISPTAGNEFFVTLVADEAEVADDCRDIALRRSEHAALRAQLDTTERHLAGVTAERDAMVASRSWRVTRVLRAANRRLSRRGRGT